jgi:hypothetical protein
LRTKWGLIVSTAAVVSLFWLIVVAQMTSLGLHLGAQTSDGCR